MLFSGLVSASPLHATSLPLSYSSASDFAGVKGSVCLKHDSSVFLSNIGWGSVSRERRAVRSSRFPGWFVPSPPASAPSPALRQTWTRSCWACVQIAAAAGQRDPRRCPSPSPSRWSRMRSWVGALASWRAAVGGAGSRCDRRSAPRGRGVWRRDPSTRRRRRRALPSLGGLEWGEEGIWVVSLVFYIKHVKHFTGAMWPMLGVCLISSKSVICAQEWPALMRQGRKIVLSAGAKICSSFEEQVSISKHL